MSQLIEFLHMGGYAGYVWSAYSVALVVLLWNFIAPFTRQRQVERQIRRRLEQDRT